jgi:hypothetical protein
VSRVVLISLDGFASFYWIDPRVRMPTLRRLAVLGPPRSRGNHGHRPIHPDNGAFFLVAGAGVRRGAELEAIISRDVAPSLAHLLEVKLGDVEGQVVADSLD